MKVIAISGWKRSGKDTASDYLVKECNFMRTAFADVLKDMVAKEYDIPRAHCDDPNFKEKPILHLPVTPKDDFSLNVARIMFSELRSESGHRPMDYWIDASGAFLGLYGKDIYKQLYWTPRALCILKGSVNRAVASDYWVSAVVKKINRVKSADCPGDVCYGFVISDLRYRSELQQLRDAFGKDLVTVRVNRFDTVESNDPSERDLDNATFDVVLDNKGTIEEFLNKVKELTNGT